MPMSYTTPKPRWWPSDLRGTDANSGDGWVGSCVAALPSGAGPKVGQDTRHSNRVFEHRCWPRRSVRVAASTLYTDGIPSAHVRAIVMGHLVDSLAQTNQSERPGRIEPLRPAYQIDRHSYRYGAYTAYEAYRPRPLPRTLRIRVRDPTS